MGIIGNDKYRTQDLIKPALFHGGPEGSFQEGVCHWETVMLKSCIVHFTNGWNVFLEPKMRAKDTPIDGHIHWVYSE